MRHSTAEIRDIKALTARLAGLPALTELVARRFLGLGIFDIQPISAIADCLDMSEAEVRTHLESAKL